MPKNLTYWEAELAQALDDRHWSDRNVFSYGCWLRAPIKWKRSTALSTWRCPHGAKSYARQRGTWLRNHRLARRAMQEKMKVERRVAYIQERIAALQAKTAWTRVLGPSVM